MLREDGEEDESARQLHADADELDEIHPTRLQLGASRGSGQPADSNNARGAIATPSISLSLSLSGSLARPQDLIQQLEFWLEELELELHFEPQPNPEFRLQSGCWADLISQAEVN